MKKRKGNFRVTLKMFSTPKGSTINEHVHLVQKEKCAEKKTPAALRDRGREPQMTTTEEAIIFMPCNEKVELHLELGVGLKPETFNITRHCPTAPRADGGAFKNSAPAVNQQLVFVSGASQLSYLFSVLCYYHLSAVWCGVSSGLLETLCQNKELKDAKTFGANCPDGNQSTGFYVSSSGHFILCLVNTIKADLFFWPFHTPT